MDFKAILYPFSSAGKCFYDANNQAIVNLSISLCDLAEVLIYYSRPYDL